MTAPQDHTDELIRSMREDLARVTAQVQVLLLQQELDRFRAEFRADLREAFQVLRERGEPPAPSDRKDPGAWSRHRDQSVSDIHKEDLHE